MEGKHPHHLGHKPARMARCGGFATRDGSLALKGGRSRFAKEDASPSVRSIFDLFQSFRARINHLFLFFDPANATGCLWLSGQKVALQARNVVPLTKRIEEDIEG